MRLIYGKYYCTEDGKVFNSKTKNEVVGYTKDDLYLYITVHFKMNRMDIRKHRMIYEYFNGAIPEGYVINHLDGNKQNNNITNLQMTTVKENARHAGESGFLSFWDRGPQKIICETTGEICNSIREAERKYNLPRGSIRFSSKSTKRIKTIAKGLTFKKV